MTRPKTALLVALLALLAAAAAALLALYLLQERLLFPRVSLSAERLARLRADRPRVEELSVETPDGVRLHGWLAHASPPGERAPLVIYFGGNGEEVSWMADRTDRLGGWSLLLVNYRGYGLSGGRPGERSMLADALLLYDLATRRGDVDPDRIVAMGRSIGTGVAVYLARERRVEGVVLVSPYDSIAAVVREHLPFLPVSLLLRHRFEAASWAAGVHVPMLALVGTADRVVTPRRSRRLIAAWGGPREARLIEGAGHNSIDRSPEFWAAIRDFLARF